MGRSRTASINVEEIRRLSAIQCTMAEAAAFFQLSKSTFRRILATNPKAKRAWEQGRGQGRISLRRKQFALAGVNATMAVHLGKQYLGQADVSKHEITGKDGGPVDVTESTRLDMSRLSDEELDVLVKLLGRG